MRLVLHIEADYSGHDVMAGLVPQAQFWLDKHRCEDRNCTLWHEQVYCPLCGKVWARKMLLEPLGTELAMPLASKFCYTPQECGANLLWHEELDQILVPGASAFMNRQQKEFILGRHTPHALRELVTSHRHGATGGRSAAEL